MSSPTSAPAYNGPDYARGNQAYKIRARKIIANNDTSEPSCSICVDKHQSCYRHPEYRKCAFCTAREITQPYCHLPGTPDPPRTLRSKRNREPTPTAKDEPDTAGQMANPTQEQNFSVADDRSENVPTADIRELEDIITAQEAHIKELTQEYDQLSKRVISLENSAAGSSANIQSSEQPGMKQSDNMQNRRRLNPTLMQTMPTDSPYNPMFQTPSVVQQQQQQRPMSPPQPANYRPPYTETGEEQSDGILPGHTMSHVAGFTPINCSCALPHTLENGDTKFPRQGFT